MNGENNNRKQSIYKKLIGIGIIIGAIIYCIPELQEKISLKINSFRINGGK